jgi:transposase
MLDIQSLLKDYQRTKEQNAALLQQTTALEKDKTQLSEALAKSETHNAALTTKMTNMLEQIKLMNQRKFASKSEANLLQQNLFDEVGVADSSHEAPGSQKQTITYTRNTKNKPKRQALPEHLERVDIIIDIDEADKICDCCGEPRSEMRSEITERLIVIPAKLQVERTIRKQYVCNRNQCENEKILIQTLPPHILPKSNASPSVMADILSKKYVEHIPLYRQEKAWARVDIKMPRNTMCNWIMELAAECSILYQLLMKHALTYDIIAVDETTAQVLGEPNRRNDQKSYIWAYRGGPPDAPVVYFEYQETRDAEHPIRFLKHYHGFVMSDAYTGYDWIDAEEGYRIVHVYCISHARRPFAELVKATKTEGHAHAAIKYFQELYAIEKYARENTLTPEERFYLRLTEAKPVLDALFKYLKTTLPKAPKGSKLGKAMKYMLTREDGFYAYLTDGRLEIDNNLLENEIRPFAIGRKNWLFLGSPRGADAACMFYSFIQTAKANHLDPGLYITKMLEKLPYCKTEADFGKLLPWNLKAELQADKNQASATCQETLAKAA